MPWKYKNIGLPSLRWECLSACVGSCIFVTCWPGMSLDVGSYKVQRVALVLTSTTPLHQGFFMLFTDIEPESHGMFDSTPSLTFWHHVSWLTEVKINIHLTKLIGTLNIRKAWSASDLHIVSLLNQHLVQKCSRWIPLKVRANELLKTYSQHGNFRNIC